MEGFIFYSSCFHIQLHLVSAEFRKSCQLPSSLTLQLSLDSQLWKKILNHAKSEAPEISPSATKSDPDFENIFHFHNRWFFPDFEISCRIFQLVF